MSKLAIRGGSPVRTKPFPPRSSFGKAETEAVLKVLGSGVLSGFVAELGHAFYGGPTVRRLEDAFSAYFGASAVSMNSATSALTAALLAARVSRDDEVIVTPWSMSASAACVLSVGATPVFADIEDESYGLDFASVERAITEKTKAVVLVDLFGQIPRDAQLICDHCRKYGIVVVEDAAQALGAAWGRDLAGTLGDVGVFSLNHHKVVRCGEGGVAISRQSFYADRLKLIRNHGETVAPSNCVDIVGANYRLGEMEAAVALTQFSRLERLIAPRIDKAVRISNALSDLEDLVPAMSFPGRRHVFYLHAVRVKNERLSGTFLTALKQEGIPASRYVKPLYRLPIYEHLWGAARVAEVRESCPVAERCYRETIVHPLVYEGLHEEDVEDVVKAFRKVYQQRLEL